MPDPITNQLINSVWSGIEDAVTSGLAMAVDYGTPRPALDTVAVVSTEKLSGDQQWKHAHIDYAPPHVRVERSEAAFDIMHHFDLSYHDLRSPDTEAIEKWATAARQFELTLALHYYAEHASRHSYTANDLFRADPGGWGQRRCVSFRVGGRTTVPDRWERADLDRVVKVGRTSQVQHKRTSRPGDPGMPPAQVYGGRHIRIPGLFCSPPARQIWLWRNL